MARRSGVAQSVISAYESGRREPSVRTLARLVAATGHELELGITEADRYRPGPPDTKLGRRLRQRRRAIIEAAERRGDRNVRVFGSVARGADTAASDVDFLVDLDRGVGVVALVGLKRELGELLGVEVDVVPAATLKARIRADVLSEAIPLWVAATTNDSQTSTRRRTLSRNTLLVSVPGHLPVGDRSTRWPKAGAPVGCPWPEVRPVTRSAYARGSVSP